MKLTCRKATIGDIELVYQLSNEELTRKNSFNSEPIEFATHEKWFTQKLTDNKSHFMIFEDDNSTPVGLVRIECKAETVIGITIDKNFRGLGISVDMLNIATEDFHKKTPTASILAYIKKNNEASIKAFEKAGFTFVKNLTINNAESILLQKY